MDNRKAGTMAVDVPEMGVDAKRLMNGSVYCGIDPGREKFGLALGNEDNLFFAAIIPFENLTDAMESLSGGEARRIASWMTEGKNEGFGTIGGVFLGNGTGHEEYIKAFRAFGLGTEITDERMTTLEARNLYWRLHPPKGLWRLIPRTLMVPPRPVDDLAAWIIITRKLSAKFRVSLP